MRNDVAVGPADRGTAGDELTARADAALATPGIMHLAERAPHRLLSGERLLTLILTHGRSTSRGGS